MKYYIPISCLNLDNILQSESISPIPFYARRKTGYDRFDVLPEFQGVNQIVLFEYPVQFSINDPNRNNYPVLIEVEDESQLCSDALQRCENGVCLYNKTLHLTPYNCRIFFFSEGAYKLITINTKDNKSIKHYDKYHIFPITEILGCLKDMPLVTTCSNQSLKESDETKNDKKKGILYAYLKGQSLSLTPELARQKYLTQEIYNTYAGIKAYLKTNERIPDTYRKKLEEQLEAYKAVDPVEHTNQSILKECLKRDIEQHKIKVEDFRTLLKFWDVWGIICGKLSNKYNVPTLPSVSELQSSNDYNDLIEQVKRHIEQSIASYKNEIPKPSLTTIKVDDKSISIEGKELLNIAINYIVDNELTQDQLTANKAEICSKIINQIKDDYFKTTLGYSDEQWNNDPHRQYALNLYNSINDYCGSFSLNDATKLEYGAELMAIASFLLRGDSIDGYLKYLLKNEVSDYSMPLVLWGALCGYMEMNRDLLPEFITDEIYENVYEHLHGTLYKATFNDAISTTPSVQPHRDGRILCADYLLVIENTNKTKSLCKELKESLQDEYVDREVLKNILKKRRAHQQCDVARQIFDHIASKDYNKLETLVSPKRNWKNVAGHFGILNTPPKTQRKNKGKEESPENNSEKLNNTSNSPDQELPFNKVKYEDR